MFSHAFVILPFSDQPPGKAIAESLARFERGRRGNLPDGWLTFHDDTAKFRQIYEASYTFTIEHGLRIEGGDGWYLSSGAVIEAMEQRRRERWSIRFADIEPDFDAFVERYGAFKCDRHPVTRQHGRWLNSLGRWDWWDLGGCFNGTITGRRRKASDRNSALSSGDCDGRRLFEALSDRLCGPEDDEASSIDIAANENIELVSSLREALARGRRFPVPGTLVLPPGSVRDEERWLEAWPDFSVLAGPEDRKLARHNEWKETLRQNYTRFEDCWAAGIAYHF